MIDINKFHGQGDIREWLNTPFLISGRIVATNGHVIAILEDQSHAAEYKELTEPESAIKYISDLTKQIKSIDTWQAVNKLQIALPQKVECDVCQGTGKAKKTECEECEGDGEVDVSNRFSTYYDLTCKSCEGDGFTINLETDETCTDCAGIGKIFKQYASIDVLGINVQCKYLELIIDQPGLQLSPLPMKDTLMFRIGSQAHGAIMGFRK